MMRHHITLTIHIYKNPAHHLSGIPQKFAPIELTGGCQLDDSVPTCLAMHTSASSLSQRLLLPPPPPWSPQQPRRQALLRHLSPLSLSPLHLLQVGQVIVVTVTRPRLQQLLQGGHPLFVYSGGCGGGSMAELRAHLKAGHPLAHLPPGHFESHDPIATAHCREGGEQARTSGCQRPCKGSGLGWQRFGGYTASVVQGAEAGASMRFCGSAQRQSCITGLAVWAVILEEQPTGHPTARRQALSAMCAQCHNALDRHVWLIRQQDAISGGF
jgi:hypothetical protein